MNVFHINGNYIWTTLHQLMVRSLTEIGIHSRVFVPTHDAKNAVISVDDNVTVDECFKKKDRFFYFRKQKKIVSAIEKNCDIRRFDIIHAYTLFTDGNAAMQLSIKYGIPYVVAVRNTDINSFFKYRIFLRKRGVEILKNASAVFFLSETYKKKTISNYVPSILQREIMNKTYVIPNGIDDFWLDNIFNEREYGQIIERLNNKKVKLIYAGGIDKNKNIGLTAKAIEMMNSEGWNASLVAVGKVVDEEIVKELSGKHYVSFFDKLPKESLIDLYRQADIFVMPSHFESFGLVYAEAMSQGLPVIYTRGQGFDGQFEDGVVGYSTDDNDALELVYKIKMICKNYYKISRACKEFATVFKWSDIAKRYLSIYEIVNEVVQDS